MKSNFYKYPIAIVLTILLMASACEYDGPASPWDEAQKQNTIIPVIRKILPENEAGSASEITLIGEYFSATPEKNLVYFNNTRAIIKSSTQNEIVVFRPAITGDTITVKVIVEGAIGIGQFRAYKIGSIMSPFGIFLNEDAIVSMAIDKDEYTYVLLKSASNIVRLTPEGKRDESYAASFSNLATDMQFGPGGYLYGLRKREQIYQISPTGGNASIFLSLPGRERVKFLDFDANGNLYAAGEKTGILVIRPDKSNVNLGLYKDFNIEAIRVFNGFVYVLAVFAGDASKPQASGVYRNQILTADGQLGTNEPIVDWAATGNFASSNMTSLTFSLDGDMYIGTSHSSPILRVNKDGSMAPLYYGLITPPADQVVWGNGSYLYLLINRRITKAEGGQILRIDMGIPGAPYFGRKL